MARTITQIENDIDNAGLIKFKEYIKDYVIKLINKNTADIDGELQKIFTEVQGLDAIVSVIPKPQAPAATDPATANDGDLFFNTTDLFLKYYHTGTWHNLAHLGAVVDLTGYYTKVDADAKFETKAAVASIEQTLTQQVALKADKTELVEKTITIPAKTVNEIRQSGGTWHQYDTLKWYGASPSGSQKREVKAYLNGSLTGIITFNFDGSSSFVEKYETRIRTITPEQTMKVWVPKVNSGNGGTQTK